MGKTLGIPKATLGKWVKQSDVGGGAAQKASSVTSEQMELARLRAENARLR